MSNDNVVIYIYKLEGDEVVNTLRSENGKKPKEVIPALSESDFKYFKNYDEEKLNLGCSEDFNIEETSNNTNFITLAQDNSPIKLNIPVLSRCQNCETIFPTKYMYERHHCDLNEDDISDQRNENELDLEENLKIIYECDFCSKTFATQAELESHSTIHTVNESNECEFCGKHFVSGSRLQIHKENHCKKAGGISKFYRSDLRVYKCRACNAVFSSAENAYNHVLTCLEPFIKINKDETANNDTLEKDCDPENDVFIEHSPVESIFTETLIQCEFCNSIFADRNSMLVHQRKHTTAKNYQCADCNQVFESYLRACPHWLKTCTEFSNVFCLPKLLICDYCNRKFKSHSNLYDHKIKKKHYSPKIYAPHGNNQEKRQQEIPENNKNLNKVIHDVLEVLDVPVSLPSLNFEDTKQVANKNDENFEMYKTESKIENKVEQAKSTNQTAVKEEAKADDSNSVQLTHSTYGESEQQATHDPSSSQVTSVGHVSKGKARKNLLEFPKQTGRNKKKCDTLVNDGLRYQCEKCSQVFQSIQALEAHRNSDHMNSFYCEECGVQLDSAKRLLIHYRIHKNLKPYICDTCGKSYSQSSHLWQHMRFHQGIKPFACTHEGCDARYTIRPDLKDHIRKVHTRERPFKCNVCRKTFLTGSVYYQHRLIHTNDRRYSCEICHKKFFRADALNNHKRIHTDERPFACSVCGRQFRQKGDCKKHVKTQHPEHVALRK
ncbi:zinc finger protein ZFP2-like [Anthonomus grandis grandis]|uniref:zinc finger protein ZFP2-like n=1 Tax=Anthonomus grandis grandis TaxID=2921223 RepID=UPI002166405B|nr:zinc finger protein ZFP2-like [Anthonomus grandis grandis]